MCNCFWIFSFTIYSPLIVVFVFKNSDAAHMHQLIAEAIERKFAFELRSYYPVYVLFKIIYLCLFCISHVATVPLMYCLLLISVQKLLWYDGTACRLGYHYKRCPEHRALAFKYELKASDQQLAQGAFGDGLAYLRSASKLAAREVELGVVLDVINQALEDIKVDPSLVDFTVTTKSSTANSTLSRIQSFYTGVPVLAATTPVVSHNRRTAFTNRYTALKKEVVKKRDKIKKEANKAVQNEAEAMKKQLLLRRMQEEKVAKLTWQPSYVAERRDSSLSSPRRFNGRASLMGGSGDNSGGSIDGAAGGGGNNSGNNSGSGGQHSGGAGYAGSVHSRSEGGSIDGRDYTVPTETGCRCAIS
jgi:hypothetical protein